MFRWLRFFRSVVVDILLLISVFLAAGQLQKGCAMTKSVICGVGPAVLDQKLNAEPSVFMDGRKVDVQMEDSLGGGCMNTMRAARQLGADCRPVAFVGRDPVRRHLEVLLKDEFPESVTLSMLKETRRSVLCGDACATVRPPMICQTLPEATRKRLRNADLVLMAPMTGRDTGVVADVLQQAKQSVLQLSDSQLAGAETAVQLSRMATWTIVNRRELSLWSGCESLEAGLLVLQGLGVERLLVTSAEGVTILEDDATSFQPSQDVGIQGSTIGAGDVFAGTFAAMLADGLAVDEAVQLAQTAAAMHLSGLTTLASRKQLQEAAETLPIRSVELAPLPFRNRNQQTSWLRSHQRTVIAASLILLTIVNLTANYLSVEFA